MDQRHRGAVRGGIMTDAVVAVATHADHAREKSPYYAHRIDLFDKYYARELQRVEDAKAVGTAIHVREEIWWTGFGKSGKQVA